jgi:hypothetical protein
MYLVESCLNIRAKGQDNTAGLRLAPIELTKQTIIDLLTIHDHGNPFSGTAVFVCEFTSGVRIGIMYLVESCLSKTWPRGWTIVVLL